MRSAVDSQPGSGTPAWVLRIWRTPWMWMAVVIILFCAPLFSGLGKVDHDNDEAIYSFAVERMLNDGDWLTPKSLPSDTDPFFEKPPLKFWLVAAPMALGLLPIDEFGLRFVDALFGSLAFLYVFGIGRKLGGPVTGLAAVMLLFAQRQLLFEHGLRSNNMEASVVLAYCGAVYHFLAWRSVNPDVKRHIFAMSLFFVLAFMTKFVAALFLPIILVLTAAATHQDRVRVYRDWRVFAAAAGLALALIAPWFLYQYFRVGDRFIDTMFAEHVMKRFTAHLDPSHLQPWHYYFTIIWNQIRANGAQIITIIGALMLMRRGLRRHAGALVVLLWFGLPLAVISSTTSKLYHYAYPFLPPVALAGGVTVGWLAALAFRMLSGPIDAFDRARRRVLGRSLDVRGWQITATVAGLLALLLAAATHGFDRLTLPFTNGAIRNSSVWRPAVTGLGVLALGAPAVCVQAALVAVLTLAVLPTRSYQENVAYTKASAAPYRSLRDCLRPIIASEVARGRPAAGVWVEPASLSHLPFYYFRDLGPWQRRDHPSNQTVALHLIVPQHYRPVLLSQKRNAEVFSWIAGEPAAAIGRASTLSGVDPATVEASFYNTVIGVSQLEATLLVMPGPFAACGTQRMKLVTR